MKNLSENKGQKIKDSSGSKKGPWIFMGFSLLLYLLVFLFDKIKSIEVAVHFYHLFLEILPFLVVVFILMVLINLLLRTATLVKYMGKESGLKGWIIAIIAGIFSMGAIYIWFPLLRDMMKKGVRPGLIAVFLYNRGIKLHWLPLMTLFFGLKYVVILTMITILVSLLQGTIIDFTLLKKKPDIFRFRK